MAVERGGRRGRVDRNELHESAASERALVTTLLPAVEMLVGVREVAAALGLCRDSVYRMCAEGTLEHYRVRNQIRIAVSEVERFLRRSRSDQRGRR